MQSFIFFLFFWKQCFCIYQNEFIANAWVCFLKKCVVCQVNDILCLIIRNLIQKRFFFFILSDNVTYCNAHMLFWICFQRRNITVKRNLNVSKRYSNHIPDTLLCVLEQQQPYTRRTSLCSRATTTINQTHFFIFKEQK